MLYDVDDLSRRIRVLKLTLVGEVAQLPEGFDQTNEGRFGDVRPVLTQHGKLGLHAGVVDGVAAEEVAERGEEVVAQERKTRTVGLASMLSNFFITNASAKLECLYSLQSKIGE